MTSPASIRQCRARSADRHARGGGARQHAAAWWARSSRSPANVSFGRQHATLLNRERTLPRSILVNKLGRRFTMSRELQRPGGAFHHLDATRFDYVNLPCWLVFDAEYLARYGFRGGARLEIRPRRG